MIKVYGWEGVLINFESRRRAAKKIECTENADSIPREVKTYRQVLPIGTGAYPCFGRMKLLELFLPPLLVMVVHDSSHICKL